MSKVTVQNNPYCQRSGRQSGRVSRRRRKATRAQYQEHDSAIDAIGVSNDVDKTYQDPPDEVGPTITSLVEASHHTPQQETENSIDVILESTTNEDNIEDTADNSSENVTGITLDQAKKIMHEDFQKLMKTISNRSSQLDFEFAFRNAK